jgi:hypothetical protein
MKHRNYRITLSTLRARAIYEAVTQFTQQHPLPRSRGRKPIYSEALILTLALLRTARRLSYRQLLFCVAPEVLAGGAFARAGHTAVSLADHPR